MSRASNDAELVARMLDAMGHTIGYLAHDLRRLHRAARARPDPRARRARCRCRSSRSGSGATRRATPSGRDCLQEELADGDDARRGDGGRHPRRQGSRRRVGALRALPAAERPRRGACPGRRERRRRVSPPARGAAAARHPRRPLARLADGGRGSDLDRDARRVHDVRVDARVADARHRAARRNAPAGCRCSAPSRRGAPRNGRRSSSAGRATSRSCAGTCASTTFASRTRARVRCSTD